MRAAQLYIKETGKYIQLGMDSDFPFTLSKSIAEIQDVSKRNKTFSKSFKIPATEDNVKALGYPHVIGTDLDAINVYKQQCFIIVNGNVIDDGYVYILKARRDTDAIEFECQFVGGNEPWVVALQSLKMSDMTTNTSGTVLQLAYTDANIKARYNTDPTTLADPSYVFINPYIYQFSDSTLTIGADNYSGDSRNAKGTDFWPAFRLDFLIDGIFGTATNPLVQQVFGFDSFKLDSDFLTDNATHGFWNNIYYSDRSEDEYPNVTFGATEDWRFFLPTQVSMLDFFMNVCKTFNLVFTFDGITLKVEPRNDWKSWNGTTYTGFYSGDVDWSNKVSVSQEIQYKTSNYKRQIRLSWSTDSYPFDDTVYPFLNNKDISQPEVRYIIDTENNNEEGITDITLPFNTSPSKFYQAKFDYKRKNGQSASYTTTRIVQSDSITFDGENQYANRLFVFKAGSKPIGVLYNDFGVQAHQRLLVQDPRWRNWIYEETDGTTNVNNSYPYIYNVMTINPFAHSSHTESITGIGNVNTITGAESDWDTIDNVNPVNPTITGGTAVGDPMTNIVPSDPDDINLGIYKSNTVNMPDGLYERFWKTTIDQLITARTLVTDVLLTRNEFVNLDISKYYTLMGQRFILNKVKDFDPMLDEQMVEVELLAVDAFRSSEEVTPPAATLLLDLYGEDCQAAYSVRKLRTAYAGSAFRVRRDSDDTEQDIGFDTDGNLDESALTTFVGSNNGFIVTWYDQTTNGNNATQASSNRQMRVVTSGTVEKIGTKVAPDAVSTRTYYETSSIISVTPPQTTIGVIKPDATSGNFPFIGENQSGTYKFGGHNDRLFLHGGSQISTSDGAIAQAHMIAVGLCNGASSEIRVNGSQEATGNTSGNNYSINAVFGPFNSSSNMRGPMQEILIYTADKTSDINNIESNINTYFSVYS